MYQGKESKNGKSPKRKIVGRNQPVKIRKEVGFVVNLFGGGGNVLGKSPH